MSKHRDDIVLKDILNASQRIIVHAYDLVDWDEVWKTATKDIPELLGKMELLAD